MASKARYPKKNACEERGHIWQPTTVCNYRVCDRSDCRRCERLDDNGQWIHIETARKPSKAEQAQAQRDRGQWATETLLEAPQGYQQKTILEACEGRVIVHQGTDDHSYTLRQWWDKEGWVR